MKITSEADYALRITADLATQRQVSDARSISERVKVSERFTVKILRKLILGGIVVSHKGVSGGYELAREPETITMREIIELIDGKLNISRCLDESYECSRMGMAKECCRFHLIFDKLNSQLAERLERITIGMVVDNGTEASEILEKL